MDDDSESGISSLDTHFVEREDDAENLWEVEAIVGERGNKYRVRWAGVDDNGKPWPLDWVPKEDCTDPLVLTWKRKKLEKKKQKSASRKSIHSRASTASTTTKVSVASSSTITHATALPSKKSKPVPTAGSKRKNDERDQKSTSSNNSVQESYSDIITSGRPKKKRKLVIELASPSAPSTSKHHKEEADANQRRVKPNPPKFRTEFTSDDEPPSKRQPEVLPPNPRKVIDTSSNSTRSAQPKTLKRPAQEEEEESDAPTARLPSRGESELVKRSKPTKPSIHSRVHSSKPPPTNVKKTVTRSKSPLLSRTLRSPAPAARKPTVPPPQPRVPIDSSRRRASPLLDQSPDSTSTERGGNRTADASLSSGDDEDSALEYADNAVAESRHETPLSPPPAQSQYTRHSRSTSRSLSPPPLSPVISKGKGRAFEPEFVPETEAEESQQSQQGDLELVRSASKTSIVSRMKARTPGSKRNIPDVDIITSPLPFNKSRSSSPRPLQKKPLRPIPQISPSKFANLPSSTIESTDTPGGGDDSSIEQFDSPEKSRRRKQVKTSQEVTDSSVDGSRLIPSAAKNVINKGVALAGAAKRAKQNSIFAQAKLPLAAIIEKERVRVLEARVDGGETTESEQKAAPSTLEEFADSFVDYNGGVSQPPEVDSRTQDTSKDVPSSQAQKVFARQEEEESTQDLLVELEQRPVPDVGEGWVYPEVPPDSQAPGLSGDEDMGNAIDSLEVAPKSSGPLPQTSQEESSQPEIPSQPSPTKRSPSRSLDSSLVIPATMSPTKPQQEAILPSQIAAPVQDGDNQHLDSAMSLLNKKSEEIARLENLLTAARSTIENFEAEGAHHDTATISWQEERARILEENKTLQESLITAQGRAEFAEKNAEVFRDQYLRVSSYADDLRTENAELQERAEVAESQASTGIASVRAMYDMRVKQLEDEAAYHKRVATFLVELGQRTQDEDVRRRAAEHPELERRCMEWEEKYSDLEGTLDGARGMIDVFEKLVTTKDKENEALRAEMRMMRVQQETFGGEEEKERLRRELEEMRGEVEKLRSKEVEGGIVPVTNGVATASVTNASAKQEKMDGEIMVYRCLWRKDGREKCEAVFLTQEGLRQHIELGGH